MTRIGNVPEIKAVKRQLDELKKNGFVKEWEVPYENILTRLTAATFFLTPTTPAKLEHIWNALMTHNMLQYSVNEDKKLSSLEWRVEFL